MEEESFRKQRQTLGIPVKLQVEISFPGRGGEFSVVMARQAFIEKDSSLSATSTCFALSASSVWASRMGGEGMSGILHDAHKLPSRRLCSEWHHM